MKSLKLFFVFLLLVNILGCASTQEDIGRKMTTAWHGKSYKEIEKNSTNNWMQNGFGKLIGTDKLKDGAELKVHVADDPSESSILSNTVGFSTRAYRITGFKVKDGVVVDSAYYLYKPNKKNLNILGVEINKEDAAILKQIGEDYKTKLRTTGGESISSWYGS